MKKSKLRELGKIANHNRRVESVEKPVENTAKPTKKRATKKKEV